MRYSIPILFVSQMTMILFAILALSAPGPGSPFMARAAQARLQVIKRGFKS